MAAKSAKAVKITMNIEYRVIGNAFGLLIACGGLLSGAMLSQRSLDYWREDIMLLVLVGLMGFLLIRSLMATMLEYQDAPPRRQPSSQVLQQEIAPMAQLPAVPGYTPEQVLEEVGKRLQAKRAEAAKKGN